MPTFEDLKKDYPNTSKIPYFELIKTDEWYQKREIILKRDDYKCTNCGKTETIPHFDEKLGKTCHLKLGEPKSVYRKNKEGFLVEFIEPDIVFQSKPDILHVHHKFYILEKLPWEYSDDDLITFCNWCHWEFHEKNIVLVYKFLSQKLRQIYVTPCYRCNGAGCFPEFHYVEKGICFRCRGYRYEELIVN